MNPAHPAAITGLPAVLWPLLFGNFVIGTGVMVVPGTLNELSASLQVSVASTGQLISAGAFMMALSAPLFAAVAAGWDRRRLLALSLLWFGLLHLACTWSDTLATLLPLRVLAVAAPAIFTPQAAASVGLLVPMEQRGRAITFIFLGWSVASVVGMPIASFVGGTLGWRSAFWMVAAMSIVAAVWVWKALPRGIRPPALSRAAWGETLRSPALMLCVAVTVLASAGQFVVFSYFAPYWHHLLAVTPGQLSLLFLVFGVFGLLGNVLMMRYIGRLGSDRAVLLGLGAIATSLLIWPLGSTVLLSALVCIPWALGCFATNSAQQARLVGLAPSLASASVALNTSALYGGQALGAAVGGLLIAVGDFAALSWAALVGVLGAMGLSMLANRAGQRARQDGND
jgi:predicted MFS family arabinose efflux permease